MNKIMKNKRGDIPVMILVFGVFAICGLAIISFIIFDGKIFDGRAELSVGVFEGLNSDVEKFYFYRNVGFSSEESAEKLGAEIFTEGVGEESKKILVIEKGSIEKLSSSTKDLFKKDCKQVLGEKILKIAREIKKDENVDDSKVKKDTGAESFECLILMLVMHESSLMHCKKNDINNCLYCNGNLDEVLKSPGAEKSYGVMQINIGEKANPQMKNDVDDFEKNVEFGINLLISNHNEASTKYVCKDVNYSGWQRALRGYNGWNFQDGNIYCWRDPDNKKEMIGDHDYVEHVLSKKDLISEMFPECGGVSEGGIKVTYKLII